MSTLPIAFGAGASAELRQPLGVAVVGGLIVSQTLTLFVTPVLYLYMERLSAHMPQRRVRSERIAGHKTQDERNDELTGDDENGSFSWERSEGSQRRRTTSGVILHFVQSLP